ncbi:hypothetical protein CGRA01v4_08169 [Colletotrichum graminicola]|uniref:Uncharacterized protein n=1 Tax=Colletotrichum graminicola (strain M1.001 / M2 / FGSC 10212) TaxID=645133 RepID=E3QV56_COLGM|nr:uncharacterized protein GLRG_09890 [Colletotrichum graminicola M1.001]EFQ34746.1 hypothetical protein GLRG_09890 [Colletotrichum graminicola M1.001]WDK16886.1 hypothetical protein CGRA01v4_08169 [Colletotrichum graminicola]
METISFSATSSKGKGVMVGFCLLVEVFLRGVTGARSQPDSKKVFPFEHNWDPANPPLWSIRSEDHELFTVGRSSPVQIRDTDAKTAGFTSLKHTWDPHNPPLWTVRPEDRQKVPGQHYSQMAEASKSSEETDPCANKDKPATLYKTYENNECPPKHKFLPLEKGMGFADTCEGWNTEDFRKHDCITFCQTSTRFEWAQEVPFPHSECHFPISCGLSEGDSVKSGWNMGGNVKVQFIKALKIGVTGGYSSDWSESEGRKFDVNLTEGQCGYFTFVPVKRIVCGGITEPDYPPRWYDFGLCKAGPKNTHLCVDKLWTIKSQRIKDPNHEIPDGTIIFVYTDCFSRRPLPMNKQDPVYHAPGVALHHDVLDGIRQSWVWNTCYMWNMGAEGKLSLYIHGSGFKDSMVGPEGKKLIERVNHCARSVDGVISGAEFNWYYSVYPGEDPKITGAMWVFMADVPSNIRPGCLGDAMIELGGITKDKCIGDKFEG